MAKPAGNSSTHILDTYIILVSKHYKMRKEMMPSL